MITDPIAKLSSFGHPTPSPCSLLPAPCSLFPVPCSLFPCYNP
ncbi:hypothetical protein [Moorena sp. SIO3A5]|nr:hypothetical protein [Moorena sp. SIO3A5]